MFNTSADGNRRRSVTGDNRNAEQEQPANDGSLALDVRRIMYWEHFIFHSIPVRLYTELEVWPEFQWNRYNTNTI